MGVLCRLSVSGIKIQKDNYRTAAGATLGETAFWQSPENEANVVSFKRAIAQCELNGFGFNEPFELIISLRAGFARVRVIKPRKGLDARHISAILRAVLGTLYHVPGHDPLGVLVPLSSNDPSRYVFCKTYDPHWLVGTLHEIMDEKGIKFMIGDIQSEKVKTELNRLSERAGN
jgi:hypothetical protein